MTTPVKWTVHPLQRSLGKHAIEWDALRLELYRENPMLGSIYFDELLAVYAKGSEHLCIARRGADGSAVGMCILQAHSPFIWRSFLPAQAQIGPTLLADPQLIDALFSALPLKVIAIDLLCNDEQFGDLANRSFDASHCLDHALTMSIEIDGTFSAYWNSRSRTLIKNMRRYASRIDADGIMQRSVTITGASQMKAAVARYGALEATGWKGRSGTAVGANSIQQRFYEGLICRHAELGQAIVWELWLGDELAASRLAIREAQTVVILKTTYRESLAAYAPGRTQLLRVVEDSFHRIPGGKLEFYTNASEDQLRWATRSRWIRHLTFYRRPLLRMAATAARLSRRLASKKGEKPTEELQISVYHHPDEFPPALLDMFAEAEGTNMQFGADWYRNLIDNVFRGHPGVKFYVLEHQGKPVATLPLLATRARLGWRVRALSNYYTAQYQPLLGPRIRDSDLAVLFRAITKDHPGLNSIQLMPLATGDRSFRTLQSALNAANFACFPYYCFGNWFMPVREAWASYLQGRDGRQRSTITRMGKKLVAEGGRLELIANDDIERGLRAYEEVYAASWKQPEPHKDFMPGLIRLCAKRGWLRLGVAWLGDQAIAAQIWIVANGRADIYKLAYDEAYKAYSPGTLLTAMLMQQAMDVDKVREIDYLIGDDPYKQSWMSSRRERWGLIAYNPLSLAGLAGLIRELGGRLIRPALARPVCKAPQPVKAAK